MDTILDCYTDEPAGLGVPPYLGVWPRYLAGFLGKAEYINIDDLRKFRGEKEHKQKTNIKIYNATNKDVKEILRKTKRLFVVLGVHVPGKYLSAKPGSLGEVKKLLGEYKGRVIITGPAVYGSSLEGGRVAREIRDYEKLDMNFSYDDISKYAVKGAYIFRKGIVEIETSRGCVREKGCSFCLEPLKHRFEFRKVGDIVKEIKALNKYGARNFRLGKQSCIYSYPELETLLKEIRKCKIDVLHVDNANPKFVDVEKTKAIVKYCTEGNVAAFGVESFDKDVIRKNNLACDPEEVLDAIRLINKYGSKKGENGMPKFLPGINLLFGLKGESKETFEENFKWLKKILDEGLLLRRINIRQVSIFKGTEMEKVGMKFIKKNKKFYWNWRKKIRKEIDLEILKRLVPVNSVLKNVKAEIYDGKVTFCRQVGTYPLIVGVKKRLELGKFYDVKIVDHMLRSVVGEVL